MQPPAPVELKSGKSTSAARTELCERMALVRQNKKRRRRRRINPVRQPARTPSPKVVELDHWSLGKLPVIPEGQFRAHVEEVERIEYDDEATALLESIKNEESPDPVSRKELPNEKIPQGDFMLNLGLFTSQEREKIEEHRRLLRIRKRDVRNKTYIPELTEVRAFCLLMKILVIQLFF